MPDITIDFAPWPIGTSVGLYDKKSELMMPDMPPPETDLLALSAVDAAGGVFFPAVGVGDYWAIGQIAGVYRYVQLVVDDATETAAEIDALTTRVAALEAADTAFAASVNTALNDLRYAMLNDRTGMLAPSNRGWTALSVNPSSQRIHLMRFILPQPITVTQIRFFVEAAGADVAIDVGIYDATFNKIVTSGAKTGLLNSTLQKSVPIAATNLLANTVYYAAWVVNTGNSASVTGVTASGVHQLHMTADVLTQQGPFPLPASVAPNALAGLPGIAVVIAP